MWWNIILSHNRSSVNFIGATEAMALFFISYIIYLSLLDLGASNFKKTRQHACKYTLKKKKTKYAIKYALNIFVFYTEKCMYNLFTTYYYFNYYYLLN